MTTPILQGVLDAVKRIAAQEGFEMVLEKSAVPYFRGDLELTDRAIQLYNSGQPSGGALGVTQRWSHRQRLSVTPSLCGPTLPLLPQTSFARCAPPLCGGQ